MLAPLGADTEGSQFLDPDGTFPNHIPNPENKEAMKSIVEAVVNTGADFEMCIRDRITSGMAFAGFGPRTLAMRDPVHTPVPGSGIATKINTPRYPYFSICLLYTSRCV